MSKHFAWYPSGEGSDQVIPWNAKYSFPSQANKASKITPRIPPKNGATFLPGNVIRLEFPAQGYVNPVNTTLEFDVTLFGYSDDANAQIRFQNNIQSIFNRVRILYGSTPLEDIINYNQIIRNLTEWTCTNATNSLDQTTISDGIGGYAPGFDTSTPIKQGLVNIRQKYIQGLDGSVNTTAASLNAANGFGSVPNTFKPYGMTGSACTRRYQVNLGTGLFTQDKLIPTKFMASQFAIEITLEQPAGCIFATPSKSSGSGTEPTYAVTNVNLIPEVIEFDSSYDLSIMQGLANGGVPLKYATWHTYIFNVGGVSNANLQVQERSRSVKALFGCQRRSPMTITTDSGATFFDTATDPSCMQSYQYRIGGRYFPAAPVQLAINLGTAVGNGGVEAFIELQKALNVVGDYRLSTSCNSTRWAQPPYTTSAVALVGASNLNEFDYNGLITSYNTVGAPNLGYVTIPRSTAGNSFCGNIGSACFTSAIDLETSSGIEISGLNAEEQSDITFMATWTARQSDNFVYEIYAYVDQMIILRENNMLEVIQ